MVQGKEGRGAFGGFIGPRTLLEEVRNGAPWLFDGTHPDSGRVPSKPAQRLHEHAAHELGWWAILRHAEQLLQACEEPTPAQRTDYFALCLAAHFASVASYVPTDVDAKIRHALWFEPMPEEERGIMLELALGLSRWDITRISARCVHVDETGPVSGHDGERLSVLCGALLGMRAAGRKDDAERVDAAIDEELRREARAFAILEASPGREIEWLNLANSMTHNAGDILQALDRKVVREWSQEPMERYGDLARTRFERYGGAFGKAATLYRELLASEGHRHYPMREQKLLRASHELLLPLGPFLDAWGARLASWQAWGAREHAAIASSLIEGCRRVAGQEGYYRALVGFAKTRSGGLESRELETQLSGAAKKLLKDTELKKKLAVRRESFESSYAKRARALLAGWR